MANPQSMYSATKSNLGLIVIVLIVFLAAALRLYKLGQYPVSIYWDEAAIGYNAYSIAQTGADEYGRKWPIAFESFNDFKLPGYIYLGSIFTKTLGLSEFSVRLPSALFGILAVILIYLLTKKLFEGPDSGPIAQISALILATSPWHIHLSRAAFEANIATTIILAGIYFLILSAKSKLSATIAIPVMFASFYFYYSSYIIAPLITITTFLIYRKSILQNLKNYGLGLIIAIVIILPALNQLTTTQGSKRVREVSIFENPAILENYASPSDSTIEKIFKNRRIPLVSESLRGYFSHLSPGFLFFGEDPNARHHPLFQGNFYIWLMPFMVYGLWTLVKSKETKLKYFLLLWILISPIPAALTIEIPHSLRSYNLLVPLVILSAIGIAAAIRHRIARAAVGAIAAIFFISYLYNYYVIYPQTSSASWAHGYKPLFQKLNQLEDDYDRVIVTGHYWKPYIYYLFYNQIDPTIYQSNQDQLKIGKYRFGIAGWDTGGQDFNDDLINSQKGERTLLAISPQEFKGLEGKSRFVQISKIQNYAGNVTLFLIGEWQ